MTEVRGELLDWLRPPPPKKKSDCNYFEHDCFADQYLSMRNTLKLDWPDQTRLHSL